MTGDVCRAASTLALLLPPFRNCLCLRGAARCPPVVRAAPYAAAVPAIGVPIGSTAMSVPSNVPWPDATTLPAGSATS